MGLEKFHLTFLALLIYAVVKSNADCNSDLLTCSVHIAALSSVIGTNGQPPTAEQVQPFCPNVVTFQTCLNNVPENCKSDPMYDGYQQSAASFSVYCSGSGSGTGGSSGTCAVMDCMQIMSGSTSGASDPNSSQEPQDSLAMIMSACVQFESFKSCVTMKSKNCPPEIMATVKNMTDSQKMLCEGDCSTYKLLQCVKNVNVSAFQAISGLPTKGQLQPICRKAESALKCMGDYFIKCPTSGDKTTKEATESLKMYEKILNVMCKEALPVLSADDSECAKNKTMLMQTEKCSKTDMTQVRDESEAEMCGRLEKERMCVKGTVENYCSEKTATDISNLFVKIMSATSQQGYDCNGTTSGFQINLWISMLLASMLLVFLL